VVCFGLLSQEALGMRRGKRRHDEANAVEWSSALESLRHAIGQSGPSLREEPVDYAAAASLVEAAMLWLKPDAIIRSVEKEVDEGCEEEALRAFPSAHTCLVCNVLAAADLLLHGASSRFVVNGSIPSVYLSCQCNFDRDDASGEIFSFEFAPTEHQERCVEEAQAIPQVRFCLDPDFGTDWLGFFRATFELCPLYELWRGDRFLRNQRSRPRNPGRNVDVRLVYSLHRSSLSAFESDALQASARGVHAAVELEKEETGEGGTALGRGGCVVAFRQGPAEAEPFGMWFLWLVLGVGPRQSATIVLVDLQNSHVAASLHEMLARLGWEEPPREEVFFAAFSRR
jgi:hypothetical protein